MAAAPDNNPPLKYQTWTLRVPIHCEGCKKKVRKILQSIDGVYMTTIDSQQHKVIVTGNIEAETLLRKLSKSGKPAQLWPTDKLEKKDKVLEPPKTDIKEKAKANEKGGQKTKKNSADKSEDTANAPNESQIISLPNGGQSSEAAKESRTSNGSKKKKKKKNKPQNGDSGNDNNSAGAGTDIGAAPPAPVSVEPPPETPASVEPLPTPPPPAAEAPPPASVAQLPTPPAGVESLAVPPMEQGKPLTGSSNFCPPSNIGPLNQHGHLPFGPTDILRPINQPGYVYPPAHYPPPQVGVSYSMAQPSNSTSYCIPPSYGFYAHLQHPMAHIPPPPPSCPINENVDDDYREYNDDASQCRLM